MVYTFFSFKQPVALGDLMVERTVQTPKASAEKSSSIGLRGTLRVVETSLRRQNV